MNHGRPLEEKIEIIPWSGCWIWTGALSDDGYGKIDANKYGMKYLHRWMFSKKVSSIPQGMQILHTCDIRCCVNPSHLYPGTQLQNIRDRVERGRGGSAKIAGELSPNAKITSQIAKEILNMSGTAKVIGRQFGLGSSQVYRIKKRQAWKHISESL